MQLFRPSNDCHEQSYNHQSSINPFFGIKPTGYGGSNVAHCQTQTQCYDAQLPGAYAGSNGYGMQHGAGAHAQGYGHQKPFNQYSQHSSFGAVQHGGTAIHQSSHGSMMHGGGGGGYGATQHSSSHATMGHPNGSYAGGMGGGSGHGLAAHHGSSFGSSACKGQSGGAYSYSMKMKRRERRSFRKRSGNDSDGSCSDGSGSGSDSDH